MEMAGCEPLAKPEDAVERAERERLDLAWRNEKARRHERFIFQIDRAIWRHKSEEAARRRGMTQAQRDTEDREWAEEDARIERLMDGVP